MKALLVRYGAWFGALNRRERTMVTVAALALAVFLPFTLVLEPALRESRRLSAQLEKQARALTALQTEVVALAKSNVDPDQVNRDRVNELTSQLRSLDESMRRSQKGLVPADQMGKLLSSLLDRRGGLRIVALRTLPATPLLERAGAAGGAGVAGAAAPGAASTVATAGGAGATNPAGANSAANAASAGVGAGIYKHSVELVLQGSYAELSAYLERVERASGQLFWIRAVLDAEAYPLLSLTVTLFTIGLEPAWLSV